MVYKLCSFLQSFHSVSAQSFHAGFSYLATIIPGVDPYRWGGWFIISVSVPIILMLLCCFKEHKPYKRPSCGSLVCRSMGSTVPKKSGSTSKGQIGVSTTQLHSVSNVCVCVHVYVRAA